MRNSPSFILLQGHQERQWHAVVKCSLNFTYAIGNPTLYTAPHLTRAPHPQSRQWQCPSRPDLELTQTRPTRHPVKAANSDAVRRARRRRRPARAAAMRRTAAGRAWPVPVAPRPCLHAAAVVRGLYLRSQPQSTHEVLYRKATLHLTQSCDNCFEFA